MTEHKLKKKIIKLIEHLVQHLLYLYQMYFQTSLVSDMIDDITLWYAAVNLLMILSSPGHVCFYDHLESVVR
jgi:hypothetical protein